MAHGVAVARTAPEAWGTQLGIPAELLGPMALVELPPLPMLGGAAPLAYEHAEAVQNALFERRIEVPVKAAMRWNLLDISAPDTRRNWSEHARSVSATLLNHRMLTHGACLG